MVEDLHLAMVAKHIHIMAIFCTQQTNCILSICRWCYEAVRGKTRDVSERRPTEGPQHWRKTMRRTARRGPRSAAARHRTLREQYRDICSKLKEEVMQTFVSLPSLICSSITITAWSLNIILQLINLIACDVWCVSVFAFERTIEGKVDGRNMQEGGRFRNRPEVGRCCNQCRAGSSSERFIQEYNSKRK